MQDKAIAPEDLRNAMEGLQHSLFTIGATLYQQSEEGDEVVDFNVDVPLEEANETIAQPLDFAESETSDPDEQGDRKSVV